MSAVLFLDIDGVLNGHEKLPGSVYCGIRPDCMARLNRVVAETACKLVISSSWRYMIWNEQMTILGFDYLLRTHGLLHPEKISVIGKTCLDELILDRGEQILFWIEKQAQVHSVRNWAVVDDDPMGMKLGEQHWRLVKTDGEKGMTDADADRLIEILGKE